MEEVEAQTPTQELSNDTIKLTVHRKPDCRIEFHVKVFAHLAQEAHKKGIKSVAKEVSLPGFRKGKAPDALVLKNFPADINKKWQEFLADIAFREAEKLAHIPLLNNEAKITFNIKSYSLEGADLTLSFETEPVVPSINPKLFQPKEVKRPEIKVEETLRQAQLFFARWIPVVDRPVKEGDFIILNVDVIDPPSSLFSNTRFEVVPKSMAKWMYDLVLGQPQGATLEGTSVPDEDLPQEEKDAFPPKAVRVHIKEIAEAEAPPIDASFAKNLGAESMEDLHTRIHALLTRQADEHVQEKLREQASEFLLTEYPFELPRSLIEKETHFRMKQLMEDSEFQKYWNNLSIEDRKKMVESIYQQSEKAVRMFYVCRKVLEDAKIGISAEDLKKPPITPLEVLIKPRTDYLPQPNTEMQQAEAFSRLLLEKAEDYIISNATT